MSTPTRERSKVDAEDERALASATPQDRAARGKAARAEAPRSVHAERGPAAPRAWARNGRARSDPGVRDAVEVGFVVEDAAGADAAFEDIVE